MYLVAHFNPHRLVSSLKGTAAESPPTYLPIWKEGIDKLA